MWSQALTLRFITYLFHYSSIYFPSGEVPSVRPPTFSKHLLRRFCGQRNHLKKRKQEEEENILFFGLWEFPTEVSSVSFLAPAELNLCLCNRNVRYDTVGKQEAKQTDLRRQLWIYHCIYLYVCSFTASCCRLYLSIQFFLFYFIYIIHPGKTSAGTQSLWPGFLSFQIFHIEKHWRGACREHIFWPGGAQPQ